jgi:hypothetical protein
LRMYSLHHQSNKKHEQPTPSSSKDPHGLLNSKNSLGTLWEEEFFFFQYFNFGQANLKIHKLSSNTKYIKFCLRMSPWWNLVQNGLLIHFLYIFWEPLKCSHMAKIVPGLKGRVLKKNYCFVIRNLGFHFFCNFCFCSWFCMMLSSMQPLRY